MKKLIFAVVFIGLGTFVYGQYVPKGKPAKAEMALTQGKLDIAKAEIDELVLVFLEGFQNLVSGHSDVSCSGVPNWVIDLMQKPCQLRM